MRRVQVQGDGQLSEASNGILNRGLIRSDGGGVATLGIGHIGGEVRERVRLDDEDDLHRVLVLLEVVVDGVDEGGLVGGDTSRAVPTGGEVAAPVGLVGAAKLSSRCQSLLIERKVLKEGQSRKCEALTLQSLLGTL